MIAKERQEQIEKHGRSLHHDKEVNSNGQLLDAAVAIITLNPIFWPNGWDGETYQHIRKKSRIEALTIVGALVAAEIDRLNEVGGEVNHG